MKVFLSVKGLKICIIWKAIKCYKHTNYITTKIHKSNNVKEPNLNI